jgi:hypothetical protein
MSGLITNISDDVLDLFFYVGFLGFGFGDITY